MSTFWSWYIALLVIINLVGCALLLFWTRKTKHEGKTTGHVYDGIEELNTPLPRWWLWLFWFTLAFSVIYLYLFPGLGSYEGSLKWTSTGQWENEVKIAQERYEAIYARYTDKSIDELLSEPKALEMGQRIFANNCAVCHGSDARGQKGFPNLTDNDWLYGGSAEAIKTSIANGRQGNMPPMGAALGEQGIQEVIAFIRGEDSEIAAAGKQKFGMFCAVCHGPDAKGNPMIGAPNLTDDIWLYGGSDEDIRQTLNKGRSGKMPAHLDSLGEDKIHLVTAYVKSLSAK